MEHGEEHVDQRTAVTNAYGEATMVHGSAWGLITWGEWCEREVTRVNNKAVGKLKVRVARGFGYMWVARV